MIVLAIMANMIKTISINFYKCVSCYYYSCYCYYYYYYYYYHHHHHLVYHSLCWCSYCASARCKPCSQGISHSSQLSTFLRICMDPTMQIFWISATLAAFDTFFMFSTSSTNKYRDHFSSICHILYISTLVLDRCTCFSIHFLQSNVSI